MSKELQDWLTIEDPADLFLAIYAYANSDRIERGNLASAISASLEVRGELAAAITLDEEREVVRGICNALSKEWTEEVLPKGKRKRAGLVLAALQALDDAIELIHPRSLLLEPGMGGSDTPHWLARLRGRRLECGYYAKNGAVRLIARGPFARNAGSPDEVPSFSLTDQFSACAVVPLAIDHDGRQISISVRVINQGIAKGVVPRPSRVGAEQITLAPLAEAKDDLIAQARQDHGTYFLDVTKGASFAPQAVFAQVIAECGATDVLLLPELVVDEEDVVAMRDTLATASSAPPRLIVCGSGLVPNGEEKPWNQADIVNASGTLLWAHRKAYAYGMLAETLNDLDIPGAEGAKKLLDDISWSDEIVVADVEGLGRCIVLICQDLMMDAVDQLVAKYEPDFVFVPILDSGTNFHRWPFKRLANLNSKGSARFVVVSSLTMQHWRKAAYPGEEIGVAVGPSKVPVKDKAKDKQDEAREICCETPLRRHATIEWRDGNWLTIKAAGAD